ncbi:hypothetical protein KCP77_15170 [Salmonella enterica subsp. enterica]|nr:hypothetical protein KCP77_15170 [Salmonella enterica subsp. enterica]
MFNYKGRGIIRDDEKQHCADNCNVWTICSALFSRKRIAALPPFLLIGEQHWRNAL